MSGQIVELSALYRAPVTVCAQRGNGRYLTTLATRDRLVLDVADGAEPADAEVGELVTIGCPDPDGWVSGEVRVVAQRDGGGLVTTAPELRISQRRAAHRVPLALRVEVSPCDDGDGEWVAGQTVDVSADGFAAQLPPIGVVAGDRLAVQLALPDGRVVDGETEVVAGGPIARLRWSQIAERDRDRIAGAVMRADAARRR